jgi:nucleoside-diphosphate-sugar epimerase
MSRNLVFGLSGQVGAALLPQLDADFGQVLAYSRRPQPARARLEWRAGVLQELGVAPGGCERILSLGPLDAFADWVERTQPRATRIVALGSTGRVDKRNSPDAHERDLAARLELAERKLFAFGAAAGAAVTVLRPTLLYGSGRDQGLTPLVERARRWRLLPWPASATGLRQPVHVGDVARAVLDCLDAPKSHGRAFDLPGAEALPYDRMVARALAIQARGARLLRLPPACFRLAFALGGRGDAGKAWLWRAGRDQVADAAPAQEAFGFRPRSFEP